MKTSFTDAYDSYKTESALLNLTPNNIFHFCYVYFFTNTLMLTMWSFPSPTWNQQIIYQDRVVAPEWRDLYVLCVDNSTNRHSTSDEFIRVRQACIGIVRDQLALSHPPTPGNQANAATNTTN